MSKLQQADERADRGFKYAHATPFPSAGHKLKRKDALRRGDPLISVSAWLRTRVRKDKGK